VDWE